MSSSKGKKGKRGKRSRPLPDTWECTLCTYKNKLELFKCDMCDTRKGTSTRKPRLSSTVVEHQQIVQNFVVQQQQAAITAAQKTPTTSRIHHGSNSPTPSSSRTANISGATSPKTDDESFSGSAADQSPCTSKTPTPQLTPSPSLRSTPPSFSKIPLPSSRYKRTPSASSGPPGFGSVTKKPQKTLPKAPSLKGVDKNSARTLAVTVNGLTVVITDYRLKKPRAPRKSLLTSTTATPTKEEPGLEVNKNQFKKEKEQSAEVKRTKIKTDGQVPFNHNNDSINGTLMNNTPCGVEEEKEEEKLDEVNIVPLNSQS